MAINEVYLAGVIATPPVLVHEFDLVDLVNPETVNENDPIPMPAPDPDDTDNDADNPDDDDDTTVGDPNDADNADDDGDADDDLVDVPSDDAGTRIVEATITVARQPRTTPAGHAPRPHPRHDTITCFTTSRTIASALLALPVPADVDIAGVLEQHPGGTLGVRITTLEVLATTPRPARGGLTLVKTTP